MEATAEETIRGTVWRWPHSTEAFLGLKAAPYQVRSIPEKKVVVILCQDGISGWEEEIGDDEDEELVEKEDELQKVAGELLRCRWEEVSLMDAIVESAAFAKGDFKGSLEAGFKSVDEEVVKLVKKMPKVMGSKVVDWSEPILWQAQYNTVAVIITPEQVYTAGCGSFAVRLISSNDVSRISSAANATATSIKAYLAGGVAPSEDDDPGQELIDLDVKRTRDSTVEVTYREHKLDAADECIVVEQSSPRSLNGGKQWLQHGKDWGAALTSISQHVWPGHHYDAMVLELKPPEVLSKCRSEKVASPVFLSPTKTTRRLCSPSTRISPLKRLKTEEPPLVTV